MGEKWDLRLDEFKISKYRYRELYNFCLQYEEMIKEKNKCYKREYKYIIEGQKGGRISNPTEQKAIKAINLDKNIELIEQTALAASEDLYPYILEAVTKGYSWEMIQPPCGRRQFYESRRKFFYLLSLKKG